MLLKDQVILVAGGSSGAGLKIAQACAKANAKVVITARREEQLNKACGEIGKNVTAFPADVTDREKIKHLLDWVIKKFGRIDILVNCAGINTGKRPLAVMPPEDWDQIMNINVTGTFNLIHYALPYMRKQKRGMVVSISSLAGSEPSAGAGSAYSASKHAMTVLTKIVSDEEMKNGIRSTVIYPGRINTPYLDTVPEDLTDEYRQQILQPEDIAAAFMYVATQPSRVHIPELYIQPAM